MDKHALIQALSSQRQSLGLTNAQVAERSGLTERSVRNALGALGNPRLSSLLALMDALELELEPMPKGFGGRTSDDPHYQPVPTRISTMVARAPVPPPYVRRKR
jgi:HTH-type transcriptional regulator / antitoxin HipB